MAQTARPIMFVCDRCLIRLRPTARTQLFRPSTTRQCAGISATYSTFQRNQSPHPTTLHPQTLPAKSLRQLHFQRSSPCHQKQSQASSKLGLNWSLPGAEREQLSDSAVGLASLPHRRLISLSGPDAPKFLQGLVTNNVDPKSRSSFYTAFLDARGRVLWDAFVWIGRDICWIEVDATEVDAVFRHLKRHKLRSKIDIQAAKGIVAAGWGFSKKNMDDLRQRETYDFLFLEDLRAEGAGLVRLLAPSILPQDGEVSSEITFLGATFGIAPYRSAEDYRLRRYLLGIPEGPAEILRETALPMEANFDLNRAIDFKKGCYVGQELTIRTKHTGVVRKRILPVQIYRPGEHIPDEQEGPAFNPSWTLGAGPKKGGQELQALAGADIKQLDEEGETKKGRSAGRFIAGVGNVGIALCRLEMMTDLRVSAEGGSWKPGMEFGFRIAEKSAEENANRADGGKGEVLRVKPFVFDWFKERERALWEKGRGKARG